MLNFQFDIILYVTKYYVLFNFLSGFKVQNLLSAPGYSKSILRVDLIYKPYFVDLCYNLKIIKSENSEVWKTPHWMQHFSHTCKWSSNLVGELPALLCIKLSESLCCSAGTWSGRCVLDWAWIEASVIDRWCLPGGQQWQHIKGIFNVWKLLSYSQRGCRKGRVGKRGCVNTILRMNKR